MSWNQAKILALDPAQNNTGYAVFGEDKVLSTGTIRLKTDLEGVEKAKYLQIEFARQLMDIVRREQPDVVVSEFPHGSQSAAAMRGLASVSGVITGICLYAKIDLGFYTEYEVKKTLFGRAKGVSKEEMMYRVFGLFEPFSYIPPVKPSVNKLQHECDALGVLATFLKQVKVIS